MIGDRQGTYKGSGTFLFFSHDLKGQGHNQSTLKFGQPVDIIFLSDMPNSLHVSYQLIKKTFQSLYFFCRFSF